MEPTSTPNAGHILEELAKLYLERNAVYKDNWKDIGPVMAGFFPRGLTLTTAEDHIRFHLFVLAVVKLTRYTNNWQRGHSDSTRDASVYLAMLEAADLAFKPDLGIGTATMPRPGHPNCGHAGPRNLKCDAIEGHSGHHANMSLPDLYWMSTGVVMGKYAECCLHKGDCKLHCLEPFGHDGYHHNGSHVWNHVGTCVNQ